MGECRVGLSCESDPPVLLVLLEGGLLGIRGRPSRHRDGLMYPSSYPLLSFLGRGTMVFVPSVDMEVWAVANELRPS